jgi:hypothetical protein
MTPEERFRKIENLLSTIAEVQARQAETLDQHDAAIRDLIVVSRTVLESTKQLTARIDALSKNQQTTDEKLHILIDTVDRLIRNQGK